MKIDFLIKARTLQYLILWDIITTLVCIMLGGVEYNKISLSIISYSYIAYVLIKLFFILILYIIDEKTQIFQKTIFKFIIGLLNVGYIIVVFLNIIYIICKLLGVIL